VTTTFTLIGVYFIAV